MFDYDYDDYFVEPSEFEKIVNEADENIKELFNERVKSIIDDIKDKEEKIKHKEKRLKELEEKIKQAEIKRVKVENDLKEAEEAENDIPKKYIDKFVNRVTKGFMPGNECWAVQGELKPEQCSLCKGEPVIVPINGTETRVKCPKCNGKGYISKVVLDAKKRKIEDMILTIVAKPDKCDITIRADVSGVGVRTVMDNLFKTEQEAQREADRRNRENDNINDEVINNEI